MTGSALSPDWLLSTVCRGEALLTLRAPVLYSMPTHRMITDTSEWPPHSARGSH